MAGSRQGKWQAETSPCSIQHKPVNSRVSEVQAQAPKNLCVHAPESPPQALLACLWGKPSTTQLLKWFDFVLWVGCTYLTCARPHVQPIEYPSALCVNAYPCCSHNHLHIPPQLLADSESVSCLDITGGAPELNKQFRWVTLRQLLWGLVVDVVEDQTAQACKAETAVAVGV
jgi:hypothetical protein